MFTCRVLLQFPEHLVAAVATGCVVSARGSATREGDIRVVCICLVQTPIPLPALANLQFLANGFTVDDSRSRARWILYLIWCRVKRHLNYVSLAVKHLVLGRRTFPDESVLKSQTEYWSFHGSVWLVSLFYKITCGISVKRLRLLGCPKLRQRPVLGLRFVVHAVTSAHAS